MKKVMVFGTFDGLHEGHLNFFKQARKIGEKLIIVVARDNNVLRIKKRKPKLKEIKRLEGVKKVISDQQAGANKAMKRWSDKAVLGKLDDHYAVIRKEKPQVICLGYDQKSFDGNLKKFFPRIKIVRLKPYKAKLYKSSILNH